MSRIGAKSWPKRQILNCLYGFWTPNSALAMPLRHTDLFIVAMSWVFVVTRFVHAGVFANSNDAGKRSTAWSAGVLVLFAMWVYFALRILLPI